MPSQPYLASSGARSLAYVIDLVFIGGLMILLCGNAQASGADPGWGTSFAAMTFLYHAYFLSQKAGVSPGKFIQNICVVSPSGPLHVRQALGRAAFSALPFACIAAGSSTALEVVEQGVVALLPVLGVAFLLGELLILEFSVARRTVADRMANTVVVNLPPLQPHRAPAVPMFSANDVEFGSPPKRPSSSARRGGAGRGREIQRAQGESFREQERSGGLPIGGAAVP